MRSLFSLILLGYAVMALAQNSPCTPVCIGPSTVFPITTNVNSTNQVFGCTSATEKRACFFSFIAGATSMSFSIASEGCTVGGDVSLYSTKANCNDLQAVGNCSTFLTNAAGNYGFSGLTIGNTYMLAVSIHANYPQCGVILNTTPSNLLTISGVAPTITGNLAACKETTETYTASFPNGAKAQDYVWNIYPAGSGTFVGYTQNTNGTASVTVKWSKEGTFKLCVKGKHPCALSPETCTDIKVGEKTINDNANVCAEDNPYFYQMPLGASPSVAVFNEPPGVYTKTLPFVQANGCISKVLLQLTILPPLEKNLGTKIICESEAANIGGQYVGCAQTDNSGKEQSLVVSSASSGIACDTTYKYKLYCLRIYPKLNIASPMLDCATTTLTLDAESSDISPLPSSTIAVTKKYTWKDAVGKVVSTNAMCNVSQAGQYVLTIAATFTIDGMMKTCSKTKKITVGYNATLPMPIIEEKTASPCVSKDTSIYTATTYPSNVTYNWSIVGGGKIINDPNLPKHQLKVLWLDPDGLHLVQASITTSCGTGGIAFLQVHPFGVPTKPIILGPGSVITGQYATYRALIGDSLNLTWKWTITPASAGTIISGETASVVKIKWNAGALAQVKVKGYNQCGASLATTQLINIIFSATTVKNDFLNICQENLPYTYQMPTGATPATYTIANLAPGKYTDNNAISVPYTTSNNGPGKVFLHVTVLPQTMINLGEQSVCLGDTITVCKKMFVANEQGKKSYSFVCPSQTSTNCDTIYSFVLNSVSKLAPDTIPYINGALQVAQGISYSYSVPDITGATYEWQIMPSKSGKIIGTTNPVNVQWSILGSAQLCVVAKNGCMSTPAKCINIGISDPSISALQVTVINFKCVFNDKAYKINFQILGGVPPYKIDALTVTGDKFTYGLVKNGDPYSVTVLDAVGNSFTASGSYTCAGAPELQAHSNTNDVTAFDAPTISGYFFEAKPNSAENSLSIKTEPTARRIVSFSVYNLQGQLIYQAKNLMAGEQSLLVSALFDQNLAASMYVYRAEVELWDGDITDFVGKIPLVR